MVRLADIVDAAFAQHYPCTCPKCRALDRAHPNEGVQLRLLPPSDDQADAIPASAAPVAGQGT
ncbi:hypothetical protein EWE75_10035 [Sphingomonas populi]|uniref:Uncharacterized protein n=1 Tax=Sphingomonas populi TaxID=2484750 RepID=A0A4Q6Y530_9SPHN|nr:hypothetical protein [Sphingomonas populi]RZF64507.1 hypothetical protein EWE75_10035 [Sphingomonas populi]